MEKQERQEVMREGVSRRSFLQGMGVTAAAGLGVAALAGCTSTETTTEETEVASTEPVTTELAIPAAEAPEVTSYESDVVVVGGGWAGMSAAQGLADEGYSVVLVDKAHPGHSGMSAWSNSYMWFDPDYDNADQMRANWRICSDYLANINWLDIWIENSKDAHTRTSEWGVHTQYETASAADPDYDYAAEGDTRGYMQDYVGDMDRHWMFEPALDAAGVTLVDFTMITNVIVDEGRVVGAVGFNVLSGTIIDFACKAVVMASGPGCFKPNGYPVGSSTWDGDYIGYNLGLRIGGKEWSDFHTTSNGDTGSVYAQWIGHYLQCNWPTVEEEIPSTFSAIWSTGVTASVDGTTPYSAYPVEEGEESGDAGGPPSGGEEEETEDNGDIRGDDNAVGFSNVGEGSTRACYQPCAGLSIHKAEGVFTGIEATTATSIPGLYYCGDALSSHSMGSTYWGKGFSSCMSTTQGFYAAEEAASYVATAEPGYITADVLAEQTEIIQAPLNNESGFDAAWLRDVVAAIMSPANVSTYKTADQLNAALTFIEWIRDVNVPKLAALDPH